MIEEGLIDTERLEEAIERLEEGTAISDSDVSKEGLIDTEHLEEAIEHLQEGTAIPDSDVSKEVLIDTERLQEAIERLEEGTAISDSDVSKEGLIDTEHLEEAIEHLQEGTAIPDSDVSKEVLIDTERLQEAIERLEESTAISDSDVSKEGLIDTERLEEAIECLEEGTAIPDSDVSKEVLIDTERLQEAIECLEEGTAIPDADVSKEGLIDTERLQEAIECLEEGTAIPDADVSKEGLIDTERLEEAIECLEEGTAIPDSDVSEEGLIDTERLEEAMECLEEGTAISDSDVTEEGLIDTERLEEAIECLEEGTAIPDSDVSEEGLIDTERLEEAMECLEEGIEICDSEVSGSVSDGAESVLIPDMTIDATVNVFDGIKIARSSSTRSKRVWDKLNVCVYCNGKYAKLPRHMEQKHKNELEVGLALSFPKGSFQRKTQWKKLQNRGNFSHNKQVLTENKGILIPSKRPSSTSRVEAYDFLPCSDCFAFYKKRHMWRHAKICKGKMNPTSSSEHKTHKRHQASGAALMPLSTSVKDKYKSSILDNLANDCVSLVVRNDRLIIKYGERLFAKCADRSHQYNYVRQKMREIGRLLIETRKKHKDTSLSDSCKPSRFQDVVDAVKATAKFNEANSSYDIPSLALKLGYSLKKCADILKSESIVNEDDAKKKEASEFSELCTSEWNVAVSCQARKTLAARKLNKPERLPLAKDIHKMNSYLQTKSNDLCKSLLAGKMESWRDLAEVMLALIVLFNRRRGGETERMELSHYQKAKLVNKEDKSQEVLEALSDFEKELAKHISRVEIIGKRGRRVPVLLTRSHTEGLDILNKFREQAGVAQDNKYIFARIGVSETPIRSVDVLRKFAGLCGALKPDLLTSTSLRKHVATMSQILSLKDNELDSLATFLGHDIRVHREYYRLPESTFQVAKISKILLALENGTFKGLQGKSLDDIEMNVDELAEVEETEEHEDDDGDENEHVDEDGATEAENYGTDTNVVKRPETKKATTKRKMWSDVEKRAMRKQLGKYFSLDSLPGKIQCEQAQLQEPCLRHRPWKQLKYYVKNHKHKI